MLYSSIAYLATVGVKGLIVNGSHVVVDAIIDYVRSHCCEIDTDINTPETRSGPVIDKL